MLKIKNKERYQRNIQSCKVVKYVVLINLMFCLNTSWTAAETSWRLTHINWIPGRKHGGAGDAAAAASCGPRWQLCNTSCEKPTEKCFYPAACRNVRPRDTEETSARLQESWSFMQLFCPSGNQTSDLNPDNALPTDVSTTAENKADKV